MGEFITDLGKNKELIERFISKKGCSCEHNYWLYINMEEEDVKTVFYRSGDNALFALYYEEERDWELVSDVFAHEDMIKGLLYQFADEVFNKGDNKFFISTTPKLRDEILKDKRYAVSRILRSYESPVFNLDDFDESIPGKSWKKVRNHINSLTKNNKIEVKDCREIEKKKLMKVVSEWSRARKSLNSKAWKPVFENFVKNDFKGCRITRCVLVNGEPCSIAAGWEIPNTDMYYSAIGIHNYRYNGLGEFAYIDELKELKDNNYTLVDLGGSEKKFFDFKKKFKPKKAYKIVYYWIRKK